MGEIADVEEGCYAREQHEWWYNGFSGSEGAQRADMERGYTDATGIMCRCVLVATFSNHLGYVLTLGGVGLVK
jgi:hypothetical protein